MEGQSETRQGFFIVVSFSGPDLSNLDFEPLKYDYFIWSEDFVYYHVNWVCRRN